jgi:hypothetical protein
MSLFAAAAAVAAIEGPMRNGPDSGWRSGFRFLSRVDVQRQVTEALALGTMAEGLLRQQWRRATTKNPAKPDGR